jgi:2-isopropylmalate synthase
VLIDYTDGERSWTTVGASSNIIEASWTAMMDSVEYFLLSDTEIQQELAEAEELALVAGD